MLDTTWFELLVEAEGEIPYLLHGPLAGPVGGDAAEVHPAGAVLDEQQGFADYAKR